MGDVFANVMQDKIAYPKSIPQAAVSLCQGLLKIDPGVRLCMRDESCEVRHHDYFVELDFVAMLNKQLVAPRVPKLSSNTDAAHFARCSDLDLRADAAVLQRHEQLDDVDWRFDSW